MRSFPSQPMRGDVFAYDAIIKLSLLTPFLINISVMICTCFSDISCAFSVLLTECTCTEIVVTNLESFRLFARYSNSLLPFGVISVSFFSLNGESKR